MAVVALAVLFGLVLLVGTFWNPFASPRAASRERMEQVLQRLQALSDAALIGDEQTVKLLQHRLLSALSSTLRDHVRERAGRR